MKRVGLIAMLVVMFNLSIGSAQELQCNLAEDRISAALRDLERRLPGEENISSVSTYKSENVRCGRLQLLASRLLEEPIRYCRAAVKFFNRVDLSRLPEAARVGKCRGLVSISGEVNGAPFELSKRVPGHWGAVNQF